MLNRTIRNLAVSGTTIISATMLAVLGATGASAATTVAAAPSHSAAPAIPPANYCVDHSFGPSNTYQPCVLDLQVLLNDVWYKGGAGPDRKLATDGFYGMQTSLDVAHYNSVWRVNAGDITTGQTWYYLCNETYSFGFHGNYWYNAGCNTVPLV